MERKFLIYVAGVHLRTPQNVVFSYFESICRVVALVRHKIRGNESATNKTAPRKVFYVLEVENLQAYKKIMDSNDLKIAGRNLLVAPMLSKEDLELFSQHMIRKRILLKKVPNTISEDLLIADIRKLFGEVQNYFKFESDSFKLTGKSHKTRRISTYSVTLAKEPSCFDSNVSEFWLELSNGERILVQKYVRGQSSPASPSSDINLIFSQGRLLTADSCSLSTKQIDSVAMGASGISYEQKAEPDIASSSSDRVKMDKAAGRNAHSLNWPAAIWIKPTRKEYQQTSFHRYAQGRLPPHCNSGIESNIRFNIASRTFKAETSIIASASRNLTSFTGLH